MKQHIATVEIQNIHTAKLNEINDKLQPESLESIKVNILDFVNDDITIISGGLNSIERIITT